MTPCTYALLNGDGPTPLFRQPFDDAEHHGRTMRKVLHVGPCDTPGGMATVMHTLAEFPPEGWQAELLASHAPGGLWAKWRAYRRARRELKRRCSDPALRPDIVHVHTAADWSWRRKARLIRIAQNHAIPTIVHVHSGQFDSWLAKGGPQRVTSIRRTLEQQNTFGVVLSKHWAEKLQPMLGELEYVPNPVVRPNFKDVIVRKKGQMLLLGRNDPVKGHDFAIEVAQMLHKKLGNVSLIMTGKELKSVQPVQQLGWISETEKQQFLRESSVLLVPSLFEGQPIVVLEALAYGLPVLASDQLHSLPASVHFVPRDVPDWVDFLEEFFTSSKHEKSVVLPTEHRIENVSERWLGLYGRVLNP